MGDIVRVGRISTINYEAGTASVAYTDRNNETSPYFPFFSFAYEMPKVDELAVVIMLPNSTTKGFIVGVPFSGKKIPAESGRGIFYKEFSDGTSILYDPGKKTLAIDTDKIVLNSVSADTVAVKGKLTAKSILAESVETGNLKVTGTAEINNLNVTGTAAGHFPE